MSRLPFLSGHEVIAVLKRLGFLWVRQRGSHVVLKKSKENRNITCVVPLHRELAIGTLRGILKQAELPPEEFISRIKKR